ncbi:MAG: hypothetical protein J6Y28_09765 [Acholeplasmatales bacterium]|nr:hypothetical protein [Methanobrevibacter sp.]MBP5446445.1 hypothetical protein [Acholeplasmatales bacterium]
MKIKNQLTLSRLIGKIDNDFNISESDWIPRVAAWVTDALSQMQILPMERKQRELEVSDKIAQFPCCINPTELKVFTTDGCEIPELNSNKGSCGCALYSPTQEFAVIDNNDKTGSNYMKIVRNRQGFNRNFVLDGNKIELNFNTNRIIIESYETATYFDDYYQCECPYIYDNGLLLEALAWYCLFKYLSRGSKHQIYDLKSQNPAINPFIQWNSIKNKAATSVKIEINNTVNGWNNFFYNSTFLPRG